MKDFEHGEPVVPLPRNSDQRPRDAGPAVGEQRACRGDLGGDEPQVAGAAHVGRFERDEGPGGLPLEQPGVERADGVVRGDPVRNLSPFAG